MLNPLKPGVLTRRPPSAREKQDIAFGWELARAMAALAVGRSVAVKERAVLAVEACEGADLVIRRAGQLCRAGGFVVVMPAKPPHTPTIAASTIESIRQAGGKVLALEAGRFTILDPEATLALADRYGLTVVAS